MKAGFIATARKMIEEQRVDVIIPGGITQCPVHMKPGWLMEQLGVPVVEGIGGPIRVAALMAASASSRAVGATGNPPRSTRSDGEAVFRADHVGSLLRPSSILDARKRAGTSPAELRRIEDAAIRVVVAKQEELGLPVVTDGELRRENWYADFIGRLGGVEIRAAGNPSFKDDPDHDTEYVPKTVSTVGKITHTRALARR